MYKPKHHWILEQDQTTGLYDIQLKPPDIQIKCACLNITIKRLLNYQFQIYNSLLAFSEFLLCCIVYTKLVFAQHKTTAAARRAGCAKPSVVFQVHCCSISSVLCIVELFALSSSSVWAMVVCFTTAYDILLFSFYRLPVVITGKQNRLGQLCRRTLQSFLFGKTHENVFSSLLQQRVYFDFYFQL